MISVVIRLYLSVLFRNNMVLQSSTAIILNVNNTATEIPNFIILQNGNTGIGIANPTTLFYVNGNSTLYGSVSGITTLNASTILCSSIATTNSTNRAAPGIGTYGNGIGDRLILYPGSASLYPYSIGLA